MRLIVLGSILVVASCVCERRPPDAAAQSVAVSSPSEAARPVAHPEQPPALPTTSPSVGSRLGFVASAEPKTNLRAEGGVDVTIQLPHGVEVGPGAGGATRIHNRDLSFEVRAIPAGDRQASEAWWISTYGLTPLQREQDGDGWMLLAETSKGRRVIVYRATAGAVCDSDASVDKEALLTITRSCLSLARP